MEPTVKRNTEGRNMPKKRARLAERDVQSHDTTKTLRVKTISEKGATEMLKSQLRAVMFIGILAGLSSAARGADIDLRDLEGTWMPDALDNQKITPGNMQALGFHN